MEETILQQIVENKDGNFYFIYKVPNVKRGIRGKTRGKVDELLIVGMPRKHGLKKIKELGLVYEDERKI